MVRLGKGYWLGSEQSGDAWMNAEVAARFRRKEADVGPPGVVERERRRRSGTGPPPPMPQLVGGQGQYLRVEQAGDGR